MNEPHQDIIIIGAGLSGLAAARLLVQAGKSVRVLEATDSPGGRIRSVRQSADGQYMGDLGPTWVWPDYQPVIAHWLTALRVPTYPQFDSGQTLFDHGETREPTRHDVPGQAGSIRIVGGPQALIDKLVADLPANTVHFNSPVMQVSTHENEASVLTENGSRFPCQRVVIAAAPRIALSQIKWCPALPELLAEALAQTPTWMAPHAKVVAIYQLPFWRNNGLSGRFVSETGPIVEAHDHCGANGSPAALFGFIGWDVWRRKRESKNLQNAVTRQLKRCFGADSPAPLSVHIQDWATETRISSPADLTGTMGHPVVGPALLRQGHFGNRLWFAGAETASVSPGLIEGAFESAQQCAEGILAGSS